MYVGRGLQQTLEQKKDGVRGVLLLFCSVLHIETKLLELNSSLLASGTCGTAYP